MSFRDDEAAAQEIIGFMLALAAVMLLFGAAVGYGVAVRDDRIEAAAKAAVADIALHLSEAVVDAGAWGQRHPAAYLNLTVTLARMPGATGFIAEAGHAAIFVNASNGPQAVRELPLPLHGLVDRTSSVSGTPDLAIVRWEPETEDEAGRIILELP